MKLTGVPSLRWRRLLPDGTKVEVGSIYGQDYVKVIPIEGEVPDCSYPLSGFVDMLDYNPPLKRFWSIFPNANGKNAKIWTYSVKLGGGLRPNSKSIALRTPGKYTGEMRKVVQILSGIGIPIRYNYLRRLTHGIYTAGDGSKWVIEISKDDGIRAKRLPICKSPDPLDPIVQELGYLPQDPGDLFFAPDNWIILADASLLSDHYGKWGLFVSCGWAFNGTGSEAQNVAFSNKPVGDRVYKYSSRYKISISETDNIPSSASVSIVEQGYIEGYNEHSIKYPVPDVVDYGAFVSLTIGNNGDDYPPPSLLDAPLYVFYDDAQEVVIKHANREVLKSDTEITDETFSCGSTSCRPRNWGESGESIQVGGSETVIKMPGPFIVRGGGAPGEGLGEPASYDEVGITRGIVDSTKITNMAELEKRQASISGYIADVIKGYHINTIGYQQGEATASAAIIPYHDREAAYKFSWHGRVESWDYTTIASKAIGRADEHHNTCGVFWPSDPGDASCMEPPKGFLRECDPDQTWNQDPFVWYGSSQQGYELAVEGVYIDEAEPPNYYPGWCEQSSGISQVSDMDFPSGSGSPGSYEEYNYVVYLVASGGVNKVVQSGDDITTLPCAWNYYIPFPGAPWQYMHVIPDSIYSRRIYSNMINGMTPDYYDSINIGPYPINELSDSFDKFFIGNSAN
jgi:hypothetical protein